MKIAIVHYHLRSSGVARVIELACQALSGGGIQVAVLAGEIPENSKIPELVPTACLPELDYARGHSQDSKKLRYDLEKTARRLLGGAPDIWHLHNHSLGKNPALPVALASWVQNGAAILFQIHDFAENRRPKNYLTLRKAYGEKLNKLLYPCMPRIGYAVLNSRDKKILKSAGFPGKIFSLPNPAVPLATSSKPISPFAGIESLVLYPCRAIRRKNIGEALLLSCNFSRGKSLAIALPPSSLEDLVLYEQWKILAASCRLPVQFEACSQRNILLGDLVRDAEYLVTTSMEEGFGMAFLEAWLSDKPLMGRNLPKITTDFRAKGLILDSLYDFCGVPVSCIGKTILERSLFHQWAERYAAYGVRLDQSTRDKLFTRAVREDRVDFGQLGFDLQRKLVCLASESLIVAKEISPALPALPDPATIRHNRQVVAQRYSLEEYRHRLLQIYQDLFLSNYESITYGDSAAILQGFLAL
ncbi:MAG: hypothetical protein C5B47_05550 [Verrucomicrobia bacterium]|nr:MAG: hypothetical protein C5B47_05550 [Verrucomicrobiota bacterium]